MSPFSTTFSASLPGRGGGGGAAKAVMEGGCEHASTSVCTPKSSLELYFTGFLERENPLATPPPPFSDVGTRVFQKTWYTFLFLIPLANVIITRANVDPSPANIPEGRAGFYDVVLNSRPQQPVVVQFYSENATLLNVFPTVLVFTPGGWNVSQRLTANALDDVVSIQDLTMYSAYLLYCTPLNNILPSLYAIYYQV